MVTHKWLRNPTESYIWTSTSIYLLAA